MLGAVRVMGLAGVALPFLLVTGCASSHRSMSIEEKRVFLLELEQETLAKLIEEHPEAKADLDRSSGYAVFSKSATKVPFVGAGDGIGVVFNKANDKRTYVKVQRFDVGGGLGSRTYQVVIIFFSEAALKKLASGKIEFGAGVEASAGRHDEVGAGAGGGAGARNENRVVYRLSESGASAMWTVRLIRYSALNLGDETSAR